MSQYDLKNWFRRKGHYLEYLDNKRPDATKAAQILLADAKENERQVTYFALLEGLELSQSKMQFSIFDVLRPTATELEDLFDLSINRLSYPDALTSAERLDDHWYVAIRAKEVRSEPYAGWEEFISPVIRPVFSDLPSAVERAFKLLALWNWQCFSGEDFEDENVWLHLRVPFVVVASHDPFDRPARRPPIEELIYEPVFDSLGNRKLWEQPQRSWYFDADETKKFELFIREQIERLETAEHWGEPGRFMDRAFGFLIKAYFSEGLDQLLWHVVALEALLDDGDPRGGSDRMKDRVKLLYPQAQKKEQAADTFKRLYNVRSQLVHGTIERATKKNLRDARTLARMATERMLFIAHALKTATDTHGLSMPSRKEILEAMDLIIRTKDLTSNVVAKIMSEVL